MKKILPIFIVIFSVIILVGCNKKDDGSKFYLDSKFYEKSEFIKIKAKDFEEIKDDAYVLYTYNSYCSLKVPCENIFKEVMDKYNLSFYSMFIQEMQKTYLSETVKYAPSIIIVKNKKVVAYLDAESDEDLDKYQDPDLFEEWLGKYIYLEK